MRISELTVSNLRGVTTFQFAPAGKNAVIWGANGSGKSGLVDAIDFLLTGGITRLTGSGTAGISLKEHGAHIEHSPTDCEVAGLLLFEDGSRLRIRRRLSDPQRLHVDKTSGPVSGRAERSLEIANKGENILTRRDLLRFYHRGTEATGRADRGALELAPSRVCTEGDQLHVPVA